jgi:TonB-dependent receptor
MKIFKHMFKVLFFCFLVSTAYSQTGTIRGVVKDSRTSETIIGANVIIEGTTIGTSTQLDGSYQIINLQPGTYNLVVTFVSYHKQRIEGVNVERGRSIVIDVQLEEDIAMLEGVQVRARRTKQTDLALLSTIKASEIVVSGISAQQISRSQDSDASMVIKRIPGVTVVDGRFIMIRGLSERYNPTMLHNVFAPSMEADVRSFSFDVIPSSLIDQILIYKSPSAELPGEFAGGIVKIFTKNIPDENSLHVNYSLTYDPHTSFGEFRRQKTGKYHWLGFNDGSYNLPDDFPATLRGINDQQRLDEIGRSLPNNWVPETVNGGLNHSAYITNALRFNVGKVVIGNITSINYNNSKSIDDVTRADFNDYEMNLQISSAIFNFNDRQYNQKIRTGLLHNWGFSFGPKHNVEFKNLYNQISSSQYVYRTGRHNEFNYYANNHSFHQVYRGIYAGQLMGNHKFSDRTSIDWVGGYSYSFRDEPDYRRFRSDLDTVDRSISLFIPFGAAATYFLGRFYSEMKENNYTAALNFKHKFRFTNLEFFEPEFSAGVFFEDKDRTFNARNLGYTWANSAPEFDRSLIYVSIDSLFHPANINHPKGLRIDEQTNPSDSYSADNNLLAGYAQLSVPITARIRVAGGVRIEDHTQQFASATLTDDAIDTLKNNISILPSAYLSYNFTEKMLVRFAYGKTVNRPEFRELAPFGFYDFNYNMVKKGNPDLKDAHIHNFDLRWEYYPTPNEIIMAGIFYKRFINPIESSFVPGAGTGGSKIFTYDNADMAISRGVEVEVRKSLQGLTTSKIINDMFVVFNTALIDSRVELGAAGLGQSYSERPMQGQSPYIVNLGLYYSNPGPNFHIAVLYNVIGKRIFMIGYDDYAEIYEMPRNLIDITITKGIGEKMEMKFGIRDFLNNESRFIQDNRRDGKLSHKTNQNIERFHPGTSFSFGFTWKI